MTRRLLAAALLAAAPALSAQTEGPVAQIQRLERAASDASAQQGLPAALAALIGPETVYLHPGAPVLRGESARAFLAGLGPDTLLVQWLAEHVEVARDTTLAMTWGVATSRPRGGGAARFGRYVAAWRREGAEWRLAALVFAGVLPPAPPAALASVAVSPLPAIAAGARIFADADAAFSALAGREGAAVAFERFAAPDGVTFSGSGLLNRGPAAIGRAFAGDDAQWQWGAVAGGAAAAGDIGWTVGEAVIAPRGGGTAFYTKYLTLWRRDGRTAKYVADAGNVRPAPAR